MNPDRRIIPRLPIYLIIVYYLAVIASYIIADSKTGARVTFVDEVYIIFLLPPFVYYVIINTLRIPVLFSLFYIAFGVGSGVIYMISGSDGAYDLSALGLGLIYDLKPIVTIIGTTGLFLLCGTREEDLWMLVRFLTWFALVNALFCLRDLALQSSTSVLGFPISKTSAGLLYPMGLFTHKTQSAAIIGLGIISSMTLFQARRQKIYAGIAAFLFIVMLTQQAAKELIGIVYCFVLLTSYMKNRTLSLTPRSVIMVLPVLLFLIALIDSLTLGVLQSRYEAYSENTSVRGLLLSGSLNIAFRDFFPFGSGFGTFGSPPTRDYFYSSLYFDYGVSSLFGGSPTYPLFLCDTWWPKVLAESGLFGTICFLVFIAYPLTRAAKDSRTVAIGQWRLVICVFVIICSIASPAFAADTYIPIIGVAWGGALAFGGTALRDRRNAVLGDRGPPVGQSLPGAIG